MLFTKCIEKNGSHLFLRVGFNLKQILINFVCRFVFNGNIRLIVIFVS